MMSNGYRKRAVLATLICAPCAVLIMGCVLPAVAETVTPRPVGTSSDSVDSEQKKRCEEELNSIECLIRREKNVAEFIIQLKRDQVAVLDGACKVSQDTQDMNEAFIEAAQTYKGVLNKERTTRWEKWERECKKDGEEKFMMSNPASGAEGQKIGISTNDNAVLLESLKQARDDFRASGAELVEKRADLGKIKGDAKLVKDLTNISKLLGRWDGTNRWVGATPDQKEILDTLAKNSWLKKLRYSRHFEELRGPAEAALEWLINNFDSQPSPSR